MTDHAMQRRNEARAASRPAPQRGAAAAGPNQAGLTQLAAALNARPEVRQLRAMAEPAAQRRPNRTGLPEALKTGVEALSGLDLSGVRVHRNSAKPAQLQAHAYAQGNDIHLGPGQDRHLPHEVWHVVQQAQGRVRPTLQLRQNVPVNDDAGLEREADVMGAKAMMTAPGGHAPMRPSAGGSGTIQRVLRAPHIQGANVQGPQNARNTDRVARGPTNVAAYTADLNATAANREAALANIRGEYRTIGAEYVGTNQRFLSEPALSKLCVAQRPIAARVYDILTGTDNIQAGVNIGTPQQKQNYLTTLGYQKVLTSTNLELLRNNAHIPLNDPVKVMLREDYGDPAHTLTLTVDFTEGQKGYVSSVADTGAGINASLKDRPNYAGEFPAENTRPYKDAWAEYLAERGAEHNPIANYSNVHHTETTESVATQIGRLGQPTTRMHLEAGVDAITKVVAEGGRFDCVSALGTAIRNDSIFYAPMPDGKFRTITFRCLWKLWQRSPFNGRYGVNDATVNAYLTSVLRANQGMEESDNEPPATGYNYNVKTSTIW